MTHPYFSIIIPCYNQANFLVKAVESIQNQSFQDWEIIIVNDGSTDQTDLVAGNFRNADERIVLHSQQNGGLSAARNAGIKLAKGQVINFHDADDWLTRDCLQTVFFRFQEDVKDILVSGFTYYYESNPIHTHTFPLNEIAFERLLEGNVAPPISFFIKQQAVKAIGNFDSNLKSCEDWDFWIRAGKLGFKPVSIPEILAAYRYLPNSMSRNPKQMYEALLIVSERARNIDLRIPLDAPLNIKYDLNSLSQTKAHFIKCLGVSLFQGKLQESIDWYITEKEKQHWDLEKTEWAALSSNLSYKYFLTSDLIEQVLNKALPVVKDFLQKIWYSEDEVREIISLVFAPQLMKKNHLKYGKILGGVFNRLGIWA